jgi:hypothetical protein
MITANAAEMMRQAQTVTQNPPRDAGKDRQQLADTHQLEREPGNHSLRAQCSLTIHRTIADHLALTAFP